MHAINIPKFSIKFTILMALVFIAILIDLVVVKSAFADTINPTPGGKLVLPTDQLWAFVAGNIAPLVAYVLNNRMFKIISEPVKAVIQVIAAAVAGGLAQAITTGGVGFNQTTFQFVITAIIGALLAHKWFWQPSTIAAIARGDKPTAA